MPEKPYTDEDLRSEAALCLRALGSSPTVADILRWLPGAYVESRRNEDRSGDTWGDLLDSTGLAGVARTIHDLTSGAADLSEWAVNLGADGLVPVGLNLNINDSSGKHRVRLHFAFAPDMDKATRQEVMDLVADAIRRT